MAVNTVMNIVENLFNRGKKSCYIPYSGNVGFSNSSSSSMGCLFFKLHGNSSEGRESPRNANFKHGKTVPNCQFVNVNLVNKTDPS